MIDLTPVDVRKKKGDFRRAMRGYEPALVDDFLDQVADRMDELVRANMALNDRVTRQDTQIAEFRERERALTEALVTAQEMREEIRQQTSREAELMKKGAEQQASQLRSATTQELAQLRAAAEQEAAQLRAAAQQDAAQLRAVAEREATELSTTVRQQREREEEELRRLRIRQEQFLGSYRALLERELDELAVRAQAIAHANQESTALGARSEQGPHRQAAAAPPRASGERLPAEGTAEGTAAGAVASTMAAAAPRVAPAAAEAEVSPPSPRSEAEGSLVTPRPQEAAEVDDEPGDDADSGVEEAHLPGEDLAAEPVGFDLSIEAPVAPGGGESFDDDALSGLPDLGDDADAGYTATGPDETVPGATGEAAERGAGADADDTHWLPREEPASSFGLGLPSLDDFAEFEVESAEPFAPEPYEPFEPLDTAEADAVMEGLRREIEGLSATPPAHGDAGEDSTAGTETLPAPGGTELYDAIALDDTNDGVPGPIGLGEGDAGEAVDASDGVDAVDVIDLGDDVVEHIFADDIDLGDNVVEDIFADAAGDAGAEEDEGTSALLRNAAAAGYELPEDDELLLDDILEEEAVEGGEADEDDGWLPNLLEDEK
jgi:cell division initiation protein